ncbi:START-like domain-containing protein [Myroides sp. JBRI-B21084]|uniref:START-like domain-containing protein n=1 Tax=Myroides sp. JBRI-B21084 TaxID=3119977 RepID=UPI0026E32A49|nr:START-like domain-containing protein [Paenimyroides cloacae]WKW47301.1 START-like domain-containing protein [Paenimyroides cloacae]
MKSKFEIEFPITASPQLLYQYIATPSGLTEWFADDVNSRGELFTFIWGDSEEKAKLVTKKTDEKVKFRWLDEDEADTEYFFELRIVLDELTKDVTLLVIDFADDNEIKDQTQLWNNQIADLKKVLGSA